MNGKIEHIGLVLVNGFDLSKSICLRVFDLDVYAIHGTYTLYTTHMIRFRKYLSNIGFNWHKSYRNTHHNTAPNVHILCSFAHICAFQTTNRPHYIVTPDYLFCIYMVYYIKGDSLILKFARFLVVLAYLKTKLKITQIIRFSIYINKI